MKYRPTVLNVTSIIVILYFGIAAIVQETKPDAGGWGFLFILVFVVPGFVGLLIDLVLQKLVKNYWIINGIELAVVIAFLIIVYQRNY